MLSILIFVAMGKHLISNDSAWNQKGGESNQMTKKILDLGKCVSERNVFGDLKILNNFLQQNKLGL